MADTLRRTLICWQALVIFILYLPPALLSLFSGARHWVLVQGFNRETADWAARATSQTHCVWLAFKCWALQASQSGSDTIKHKGEEGVVGVGGALQCSSASQPHLFALEDRGANHVLHHPSGGLYHLIEAKRVSSHKLKQSLIVESHSADGFEP